jgi:hypothetical protein
MNPVSTRGRSMARDRRVFRALFLTMGLLNSSLSSGCLRSPLRSAEGPIPKSALSTDPPATAQPTSPTELEPQTGVPIGDQAIVPSSLPAASVPPMTVAFTPPNELEAAPMPVKAQAELAQPGSQTPGSVDPVATPAAEAPNVNSTPLLDAAIERVAAVRQQQRELLEAEAAPAEPVVSPPRTALPGRSPGGPSLRTVKIPDAVVPTNSTEPTLLIGPKQITHDDLPAQPALTTAPQAETPRIVVDPPSKPDIVPGAGSPLPPPERPEVSVHVPSTTDSPATDETDPLGIGKLRLCRKVRGFGSFDTVGETDVKVGQRILVYCEMTGMRCEAKNESFVSKLASKIEISLAGSGTVQWLREFGPAEDVCGSRRRDFYVNYRVDLPKTLAPGLYRLRLTQTDLIAQRSTSAEIPFEIHP